MGFEGIPEWSESLAVKRYWVDTTLDMRYFGVDLTTGKLFKVSFDSIPMAEELGPEDIAFVKSEFFGVTEGEV